MKILVTGTAGFIGSHLANKLIARGDEVVCLDSINDYYDISVKYGRLQRGGIEHGEIEVPIDRCFRGEENIIIPRGDST